MWAKASPNIAFLKYWGKRPQDENTIYSQRNLPLNASLSMTLSKAASTCRVEVLGKGNASEVLFQDHVAPEAFARRVLAHVDFMFESLAVPKCPVRVETFNNFPTAQGMASSASGMAALTLACHGAFFGEKSAQEWAQTQVEDFARRARAGSGSAARSVSGPFVKWQGTSAHRLACEWKLFDTILCFGQGPKDVPSSAGHVRAPTSPLFSRRLETVEATGRLMEAALSARDLAALGPLIEEEALELHALALTSRPPIFYMNGRALEFLKRLEQIPRRDFHFTLDAGPNVHLISERPIEQDLRALLAQWDLSVPIWKDEAGLGPVFVEKPKFLKEGSSQ